MAATIATGLVASQLMLLLCTTATATVVPLPGFPAVVDGAVPPTPATVAGGTALPKLPLPFPAGQSRLPFPGDLPHLPLPLPNGPPHLPFPLPGGNNLADCLNAVHQAESCVVDVVRSLLKSPAPGEGVVSAGKACCGALQAVGDRCFRGVLPVSPFRALYTPLVRLACGGGGPIPELLGHLAPGPRV
jgi:hypothetical protein